MCFKNVDRWFELVNKDDLALLGKGGRKDPSTGQERMGKKNIEGTKLIFKANLSVLIEFANKELVVEVRAT